MLRRSNFLERHPKFSASFIGLDLARHIDENTYHGETIVRHKNLSKEVVQLHTAPVTSGRSRAIQLRTMSLRPALMIDVECTVRASAKPLSRPVQPRSVSVWH